MPPTIATPAQAATSQDRREAYMNDPSQKFDVDLESFVEIVRAMADADEATAEELYASLPPRFVKLILNLREAVKTYDLTKDEQ
jgi:hypothetical protein